MKLVKKSKVQVNFWKLCMVLLYTTIIFKLYSINFLRDLNESTKPLSDSDESEISSFETIANHNSYCEDVLLGCFPLVGPYYYSFQSSTMTKIECLVACSKRNKSYAGLYKGNSCICASNMLGNSYTKQLPMKNCAVPCSGNNHEPCGGLITVTWMRLKTLCFDGKSVPENFEQSRSMGCFQDDFELILTSSNCSKIKRFISTPSCILSCSMRQQPLAFVNNITSTCICGKFTNKFNWAHRTDHCNEKSLRIYRTLSPDKRCEHLRLLLPSSSIRKSVLVSFPGSGNTWIRHMIEQATGIYTGSVYGNKQLFSAGFLGEMRSELSRTFVIKDHMLYKDTMRRYPSAIFLVRNPYDAYVADFNRIYSKDKNPVGFANETTFAHKFAYSINYRRKLFWDDLFKYVLESKRPYHLLFYEDLVQNPIKEIKKILDFLQSKNGFKEQNLDTRLTCLSENLQGSHQRKKTETQFDPYNNELIMSINKRIEHAQQILAKHGLRFNISSYKKNLD